MNTVIDAQIVVDPDWTSRNGYDAQFLGVEIPLPRLTAAMLEQSAPVAPPFQHGGDPHLLAYFNFSIIVNSMRCMRAISVVWSVFTSLASLNTVSSSPAP